MPPKVIADEDIETDAAREGKEALDAAGTFGASWRIMLFRSIRDGDLTQMTRICDTHPTAIHENFTAGMKEWELQWESLRWFEFCDCTALYLACAYCRENVVSWLLSNGVDPDTVCYAKQAAVDVVGQCALPHGDDDGADGGAGGGGAGGAAARIELLLKQPRRAPMPPVVPTCFAKIGFEDHLVTVYDEVTNPEDPDGPKLRRPRRVTETVVRCKISATYKSYWLPPKTNYELRVRELRATDWKVERTQATHKIVTGLLPDTMYEVQVRAKNAAGWSDFTEAIVVKTPKPKKKENAKGDDDDDDDDNNKGFEEDEEEKKLKEEETKKLRRKASVL